MKKYFMLLLALGLFAGAAKAQISYGVKAGVNIAKESFSFNQYVSSYFSSFNGGIFVNYKTPLPIAIQLEAFYSGEGTNDRNVNSSTISDHIREGYLNIPLLVQYKTSFGLYAETGPQLGILLSSKERIENSTTDIKQYYKSTDFSWCVGAGYELLTGPVKGLGVNARYAPSLTRINKEDDGVGAGNLKNEVFSIDLTYRLPVIGGSKK